ncbi:ROK family protein [Bacillus cereus group sp. MYBK71-2]|uniref:ROK family protein n=1 Tax=Bacillus cereus group TaxID=86661 RepID=UPI000CD85061|nr:MULTISPECIES: ROK family protein [Bacillus cereus group]MCC2337972.1 ROK family protein [Bacillus tropicus]MCU5421261.1 ROK family protein [Bacillus tropicus]MDA1650592.1 ROK family protein [Bacillus cereus group sp. TH160LC]MDA1797862.1 ROK family protein [Bacillus cereus group sp. BY6-1LC]
MKKAVGIDIGGTKIAAGVISETGELLERAEIKSDPSDREKMFGKVVEAMEQVLRKSSISIADIEGIGVGVPGKVDFEKGIAVFQNNLPWRQFPISVRLQEQFGIQRITIDNDVYMAAYAEWRATHVKEDETFVYVTISTGISCSIIHRGSFFRGAGFAGELGLIPVLTRGGNERLEKIAAGPGIQRIAERALHVDTISTKDVFASYKNGVPEYQSIINEVTDYLAQGLYKISCLLDPHRMIFGGSVIVKNPFLLELIKVKLKNFQLPEQQHLLEQMSISTLAQNNGVVGAGLRVFEGM